jgi:hypothetical protein
MRVRREQLFRARMPRLLSAIAMDNVFIERVWRSLKYEEVHLKSYAGGGEARRHRNAEGHFHRADLLPVPHYHVVFTVSAQIANIEQGGDRAPPPWAKPGDGV